MSGPDASADWGTPEIVRAINRLGSAIGRVETKVDGLRNEFVPREVYRAEHAHTIGRVDEIARELTDLRADYTRREKATAADQRSTWRWGVGLAATAVLAVLGLVAQLLTALG